MVLSQRREKDIVREGTEKLASDVTRGSLCVEEIKEVNQIVPDGLRSWVKLTEIFGERIVGGMAVVIFFNIRIVFGIVIKRLSCFFSGIFVVGGGLQGSHKSSASGRDVGRHWKCVIGRGSGSYTMDTTNGTSNDPGVRVDSWRLNAFMVSNARFVVFFCRSSTDEAPDIIRSCNRLHVE